MHATARTALLSALLLLALCLIGVAAPADANARATIDAEPRQASQASISRQLRAFTRSVNGRRYVLGARPRNEQQYRNGGYLGSTLLPSTFDCSSFAWFMYRRLYGITIDWRSESSGTYTDGIWRSASANNSMSKTAARGRHTYRAPGYFAGGLRAGDMLLYDDTSSSGSAQLDHVVVYLGVDRRGVSWVGQASSHYGRDRVTLTTWSHWSSWHRSHNYVLYGSVRANVLG